MLFDELELTRMVKKGLKNLNVQDEIKFNILNFIRCIHLNGQNFYETNYSSKFYGDLEMTFEKEPNCLIGHCRATIKNENRSYDYLFTENGYELLDEVLK